VACAGGLALALAWHDRPTVGRRLLCFASHLPTPHPHGKRGGEWQLLRRRLRKPERATSQALLPSFFLSSTSSSGPLHGFDLGGDGEELRSGPEDEQLAGGTGYRATAAMSWRRGGGGDGGVSRRWAVLLCVGSFCLGLLFTNR